MTIRVAIVDDQALIRSGFSMILNHQDGIDVVAECVNGLEAVDVAREQQPDVMLMDIRMPEMDGLEALRCIKQQLALPVRILMLSTFDLDEYVFTALKNGASGFVLKDTPPEELIAGIKTIAGGAALFGPSITRKLIGQFAQNQSTDREMVSKLSALTDRETEVLKALAGGRSNLEIGEELFIGETTVKTHVSNILAKLHLRDRAQAVIFAYESGLVRPGLSP